MAYKRAPTWGEGKYPASWGLPAMTWGGCFLTSYEVIDRGIVKMDNTPSANVYLDNTISADVKLNNTPSGTVYKE